MFSQASEPISLSDLLQAKALNPLSEEAEAELLRLAALDVVDCSKPMSARRLDTNCWREA